MTARKGTIEQWAAQRIIELEGALRSICQAATTYDNTNGTDDRYVEISRELIERVRKVLP